MCRITDIVLKTKWSYIVQVINAVWMFPQPLSCIYTNWRITVFAQKGSGGNLVTGCLALGATRRATTMMWSWWVVGPPCWPTWDQGSAGLPWVRPDVPHHDAVMGLTWLVRVEAQRVTLAIGVWHENQCTRYNQCISGVVGGLAIFRSSIGRLWDWMTAFPRTPFIYIHVAAYNTWNQTETI